ncbi:hypothetical protein KKI24_11540 [bacterium]|nr:hypothetical protein [bacterium]
MTPPTKQEIEEKLQKMSAFVDGTVTQIQDLLDAAANDPHAFEKQVRQLGKHSTTFIRKQKLEIELKILRMRLREVEKRIEAELGGKDKENTQPQ